MTKARWNARENAPDTEVPASCRVLAIASGKGGVGKSSVTVNLAAALAAPGFTVGVLDADIWGFSVPRLLGISDRMEAQQVEGAPKPLIIPNERVVGDGLLKVVSTGFLVEEETALMWRGLMLTKAVEQFLRDVRWGDLDYLLIDMPPGTGDVQMGLARMLPHTDLIVVTTPALAAQKVAQRAADMAKRSFLRVVGVIENMSTFTCDHGESYALFGAGGGAALAESIDAPLLGQVPLEPAVAAAGDAGEPVVIDGTGEAAEVFRAIAARIADRHRARATAPTRSTWRAARRGCSTPSMRPSPTSMPTRVLRSGTVGQRAHGRLTDRRVGLTVSPAACAECVVVVVPRERHADHLPVRRRDGGTAGSRGGSIDRGGDLEPMGDRSRSRRAARD